MSVNAVGITHSAQVILDLEFAIERAEERLNEATHEGNESMVAQWQGYLEITGGALLEGEHSPAWALPETLGRFVHRQETIIKNTRACTYLHAQERQGKRNACRAIWRLIAN